MEYLIGDEQRFLNFLDSITSEDKIGVFTHTDLDGISSAVFLKEILESKHRKIDFLSFLNINPNMLRGKANLLKENGITKLFISDLAVDNIDYLGFVALSEEIDTLLIDHHPYNPKVEDEISVIKVASHNCAAYAIFELGRELFDSHEWEWLLCAAMFAEFSYTNRENFEFMKSIYPELNLDTISTSLPGMNARKIASALIYFDKDLKHVYELLLEKNLEELEHAFEVVEEEINAKVDEFSSRSEFYPEKKLYIYNLKSKFNIGSAVTTIISKMKPDYSFLTVSEAGDMMKISSRNQGGTRDMNLMMKNAVLGIDGASGGGHSKAAGARVRKEDFEKFKQNILNF